MMIICKLVLPSHPHSENVDYMPSVESTENTYLKRINTLNQSYAIPLRQFSKSSSTRIIDKYEVTLMFGKIEYIVNANQSLLPVLETCLKSLIEGQNDWLDWLCEQLENIQKPYRDYLPGYDLIKDTEQRLLKKSKGFRQFCERTKEAMYNDGMVLLLEDTDWNYDKELAQLCEDMASISMRSKIEEMKKLINAIQINAKREVEEVAELALGQHSEEMWDLVLDGFC
ncbi:hypothetical protein PPACK8108_LOCUS5491 [Phakopsora pachyrhizi]|uniref:DH domain-containing protein n=1 Tax=Phakopsora pachyrhizi TaxID=170000 RepID=A0AAV0ANZ2_PHAPC|nr:hypothetical protein PPACK8108_LOCUS5491 [Phakopsora pachyrhizi]